MKILYASEITAADGPEDAFEIEDRWGIERGLDIDKEAIARDAAEDYFYNHDGWDDSWPQVFTFWSEDHVELFQADIELDYIPSFSASLTSRDGGGE